MKQHAPATLRNREPLLEVLRAELPNRGKVLEIASGTGEHAVFFARELLHLEWQPSDVDATALASISAHRDEAGLVNLLSPVMLDVHAPKWPVEDAAAIVCINMIHIAPWSACVALFSGAARLGVPVVVLYGPYRFDGVFTAPSNEAFDRSLRERNPSWGVRDLTRIKSVAKDADFELETLIAMPANNHSVVFRMR
jgi:hypothetical protein